jgi:hypothetical protein
VPKKKPIEKQSSKAKGELEEALERARGGDRSALPAVQKYLDEKGEGYFEVADMARVLQAAQVKRIVGEDLLAQETVHRCLKELHEEIGGQSPTPLERLLVERIVVCWLQLYETESRYAESKGLTSGQHEYYQKRVDRQQRRYISAIKALAQVRRLLGVPNVQINIAEQQVNVSGGLGP